jgi:preprotein translocase subunit SecY
MSKTCNGCGSDKLPSNVPYVVHESAMARAERQNKRLVWVIVLLIVLLVGSNIGWLVYESQFETVETNETIIEATQDGEGTNIVGGGDVNYGTES